MHRLVDAIEASPLARKRVTAIFKTLARTWTVQEGCRRLGIGRTRFQDLRQRALAAAISAMEERPAGRPRGRVAQTCRQLATLRRKLAALEQELRRTQVELDIARSDAGPAVTARVSAKGARR